MYVCVKSMSIFDEILNTLQALTFDIDSEKRINCYVHTGFYEGEKIQIQRKWYKFLDTKINTQNWKSVLNYLV